MSVSDCIAQPPRSVEHPFRLDELALAANDHHQQVVGAVKRGLAHALAAGAALNLAKAEFDGESWGGWVLANLSFSRTTANWYMRIDHFRDELAAANVDSFKGAMAYLRQNERHVRDTLSATQIQAIYALLDDGLGQTEIAAKVGISKQGVHHHKVRRAEREHVRDEPVRPPAPRRKVEITDEMIEAAAEWLCAFLHRYGHPQKTTDQIRSDALGLLGLVLAR